MGKNGKLRGSVCNAVMSNLRVSKKPEEIFEWGFEWVVKLHSSTFMDEDLALSKWPFLDSWPVAFQNLNLKIDLNS